MCVIEMYDINSMSWVDIYISSNFKVIIYMYNLFCKKYKNYSFRVCSVLQSNEVSIC